MDRASADQHTSSLTYSIASSVGPLLIAVWSTPSSVHHPCCRHPSGTTKCKIFCPAMLEFFRNIFKKLRWTIGQERYAQEYGRIVNMLRRVTPLEPSDVEDLHASLRRCVSNPELLDRKMGVLMRVLGNKPLMRRLSLSARDMPAQMLGRRINNDRDVSYYINGKVICGEVGSEEESTYFSKEHVESLNSVPLRPKKCDLDCVVNECKSCMEKRLRAEISRSLEAENRRLSGEKTKRRKKLSSTVTDLNEQLGVPKIFGISVADDCFDAEELDSDERGEFARWKKSMEANAKAARGLDLRNGYEDLDKGRSDPLNGDTSTLPGEIPASPGIQPMPDGAVEHGLEASPIEHGASEKPVPIETPVQDFSEQKNVPSPGDEPSKNSFAGADEKVIEKPFAIINPFSSISNANASSATGASPMQSSAPEWPSPAITNPFSTMVPKDSKPTLFSGIAKGNGDAAAPQIEPPQLGSAASLSLPGQSGSIQSSIFSNPFANASPASSAEPPKLGLGSVNPFVQNAAMSSIDNPFRQHSAGLQLANPFAQGNPFSSKNIFQNTHGQDDPGLFASNDTETGDGFKRKRAHRKR